MEDYGEDRVVIMSSSSGSSSKNSSKKESPAPASSSSSSPGSLRRMESLGELTSLPPLLLNSRVSHHLSTTSIQNSPRVMRAAVLSHDRPFDNKKSSEDLILRGSLGSRSLDPGTWTQVAIPIDLEPFLNPEKLFYPVVDSPK